MLLFAAIASPVHMLFALVAAWSTAPAIQMTNPALRLSHRQRIEFCERPEPGLIVGHSPAIVIAHIADAPNHQTRAAFEQGHQRKLPAVTEIADQQLTVLIGHVLGDELVHG